MSLLKQLFGNLMSGHGGNKYGSSGKHGSGKHGYGNISPNTNAPQISCSKCNSVNAAGAKFCNSCGSTLAGSFCSGCGQALSADAKFCGQCGKERA